MPILSHELQTRLYEELESLEAESFYLCSPEGHLAGSLREAGVPSGWLNAESPVQSRREAFQESVRWGEPWVFSLLPGLLSWIVPLNDGNDLNGALTGTPRLTADGPQARRECVTNLMAAGCTRAEAEAEAEARPAGDEALARRMADAVFTAFYRISGWRPGILDRNRAEAIRRRKMTDTLYPRDAAPRPVYPLDEERTLLALMKSGDRKGARRILNRLLGSMFARSPDIHILRARATEMMGYLVRAAVEDHPRLSPAIERNYEWMGKIVQAHDFEELTGTVIEALNAFMDSMYLVGASGSSTPVYAALRCIEMRFREPLTLEDVAGAAGLSVSRIAHLTKEVTGRTIVEHLRRRRVEESRRLLEQTDRTCADIALDVGFGEQSYFIRRFRQATGVTPGRYRREMRGDRDD
ncbi:helix-turn-helix transcriptional regulator [Kiritimatiella glycovorans]|uniref:AraC family transcriptional regulator n=1 Tax=Kiritimatiella glycovorans TaxID=1307763 RepID=A0A0G3EFN2_9BACT|nr:AraC family transcriptional regulator [Kiritimatiella glycovorans]AKJ63610.1 AraC family transcriptional regulator [Kiritimatiella glycovorans]